MYFFYFDESGSRDPKARETKPDGAVILKDHIYSLTAVGLWEGHWRSLEREIANLKLQFTDQLTRTRGLQFDLADCEMKSNWIRNPKERADKSPFLTALSDAERERLVACFFRQISRPAHDPVLSGGGQAKTARSYDTRNAPQKSV